jgi:hypothetical protein
VWPALAAFPPTATVDSPIENITWTGAASDFHVTGHAHTDSGAYITKVTVNATPSDANPKTFDASQAYSGQSTDQEFDIPLFPDLNGKYKITVIAWGKSCFAITCTSEQGGPGIVRNINLAVPPKAPTGTKATITDGKVAYEWASNNTEGDLLGYIVERAPSSLDYKCITTVTKPATVPATYKITDDIKSLPDGDYRYRVKAVRRSNPDSTMSTCTKSNGGIASPASVSSKVTWKDPTATTTTTSGGGGNGGGGGTGGGTGGTGGGSNGGSATTTTVKGAKKSSDGTSSSGGGTKTPNLSALGSLGVSNNLALPPKQLAEADPGFNDKLPFGAQQAAVDPSTGLPDGGTQSPDASSKGVNTALYLAASLLAGVLAAHVFWLKAQVDHMPLEALTPEELPLG